MKNLEIFDRAGLFHFTENDRELAVQLLRMALQDMPEFYSKAKQSFMESNTDALRHNIHNIKGISGTAGAKRIHTLSSWCEQLLLSNPADEKIPQSLYDLEDAIHQFCSHNDVLALTGSHA